MLIELTHEQNNSINAIEIKNSVYRCNRCLNEDLKLFYKDQLGIYCLKCLTFGKSASYKLITRQYSHFEENVHYQLTNPIQLSLMQQKASEACVEAYRKGSHLLIFAVCGAGKTEIVYDVILNALNDKKTICFATPRKDVVLEIMPRFKRDIEHATIIGLYGGSPDKGKVGNFYVCTTHQLINFYHYFDLIILDEVDAFPYYNDIMLEGFIKKSKKEEAPILFLTATPTTELKLLMKQKKLNYFIIPARFHGFKIPLPKVKLTLGCQRDILNNKIPYTIKRWLNHKKQINKQAFIFVPKIDLGEKLFLLLKDSYNCRFVYSEMKERKELINDFRSGNIQFLITTTILERGVTVSNVDVCIIKADDTIFDERSIVQIVGRAGRNKNYPTADVTLFADVYTKGIKDAMKHIKQMNRYAFRQGLLRDVK
jgi:competence protein ComFA